MMRDLRFPVLSVDYAVFNRFYPCSHWQLGSPANAGAKAAPPQLLSVLLATAVPASRGRSGNIPATHKTTALHTPVRAHVAHQHQASRPKYFRFLLLLLEPPIFAVRPLFHHYPCPRRKPKAGSIPVSRDALSLKSESRSRPLPFGLLESSV